MIEVRLVDASVTQGVALQVQRLRAVRLRDAGVSRPACVANGRMETLTARLARGGAPAKREEKVHVSRLSAAASEFRAALVEAFVRHSGLIFLVTAIPFGLLFVLYVKSGNTPIVSDTVVTPDSLHPLHGLLILAVYGLASLVFRLFVWWVGIPVLILVLLRMALETLGVPIKTRGGRLDCDSPRSATQRSRQGCSSSPDEAL